MTGQQAVEVLKRAGFSATLVKRPPGKILGLLMPVVLLLRNGDAVILTKRIGVRSSAPVVPATKWSCRGRWRDGDRHRRGVAARVFGLRLVGRAQKQQWSGAAAASHVDEPDAHWLWSTMRNYLPYYRGRWWQRC